MDLYPAIDLLDGRCVRLYQGDYDRSTVYGDDPVAQALAFQSEGAPWVHVVDLDAARTGEPRNRDVVAAIAGALDVPVLFVSGDKDAFGSPDELTAAAEAIPGPVTFVWLRGGHDPRNADDAIVGAVRDWLKSL